MSRKLPPFLPGHYYHLYNRGVHRQPIFREADKEKFGVMEVSEVCFQEDCNAHSSQIR